MDITNRFDLRQGDCIIAPPKMKDTRFNKSVIMMTKLNEHGSQGFVLNRPTEHGVNTLIEDTGTVLDINYPLYWGGPVNPNTVWMLHDANWALEQTIRVNEHWAMTSHRNMFDALKLGHIPARFRILYGFAAWGMDQLENEIQGEYPWTHNSSWLLLHKPDPNWICDRDDEEQWSDAITFASNQTVSSWL
jgi:putative transcriptional regulator